MEVASWCVHIAVGCPCTVIHLIRPLFCRPMQGNEPPLPLGMRFACAMLTVGGDDVACLVDRQDVLSAAYGFQCACKQL